MTAPSSTSRVPSLDGRVRRLVEDLRPFVQSDGGDLQFLGVTGGVVRVRLMGACVGCPSSELTLRDGIEAILRREFPDLRGVEAVNA